MDETQFLLFKKMVELVKSQEARIQQLERQISPFPQVIDLSEDVAELDQLIRELPGVHFRDPNCDREDETLNSEIDAAIDRQAFLESLPF